MMRCVQDDDVCLCAGRDAAKRGENGCVQSVEDDGGNC